jgi:hypothetical protein
VNRVDDAASGASRSTPAGTGPISPPPITRYLPHYHPLYLANGLVGLRLGRIPLIDGVCVVNGLVELDPVEDGEGLAMGPYPIAGDLEINDHLLSSHPELAGFLEQRHDFSSGEVHTRFEFRADGVRATVELLVFCSRTLPTLVLKEMVVEVDGDCDLTVSGSLDPPGRGGRWLSRRTTVPGTDTRVVDGLLEWETRGRLSSCGAAYSTVFDGGDGVRRSVQDIDQLAPLSTSYAVRARPGRRYVLRQTSSVIPSHLHSEPDREAARMTFLGATRGLDVIRAENRAAWAELWKGRIKLLGADRRWQSMADAAFYYVHASAHASSVFSTPPFGLSRWPDYHYYHGHVMWDLEAFVLPVFTLTAPDIARSLLQYRLGRLPAARRNAAMNGYAGIQFPWGGSPVRGEEVIRLSAPRIIFEQHVSLSIAVAFARYIQATGDEDFLRDDGWPVLSGVASWIASRVVETVRGFEIRACIGIAEQSDPVDNNAYMNMAAAVALREAAAFARRLGRPGAETWTRIAEHMFIPRDPQTSVIQNHEGYSYRPADPTAATPEVLAAFFPLGYEADPEVERATLRFYLERTGAYVGYPMLSAPMGVWAAWQDDRELSARLFEAGYAEFIDEPFWITNEFSTRFPDRPKAGPLLANAGGFLTGCLYGLPGLALSQGEPESWLRRPVAMPALWDGVEVDRLWVRGQPASLVARHGDQRARIEPLG